MVSLGLFALAFAASFVRAQNPSVNQTRACGSSIFLLNHSPDVTYSTTNDAYYTATWEFDPALCVANGNHPQIPVTRITLTDDTAGQIYQCPIAQFTTSGQVTTTCTLTYGEIAQYAQDGDTDWIAGITIGVRRQYEWIISTAFFVTGETPPTPSGDLRKRTRSVNEDLKCANGESWCRTGSKSFECLHTSKDINACGACPFDDRAVDCTAIEGVNNVECKNSACQVNSCLRGYQVSSDRKSCVSNARRLVTQARRR